jgi:gamma-glutamylputrescine oxidase
MLGSEDKLTRDSYYIASAPQRVPKAALQATIEADVGIVGAGLAGLSAALELRQRGYSVVLLEARQIGWGASGRNGGQVIAGLACDIGVIERQLGAASARTVWNMTLEAIELIHQRRAAHAIDCDWQAGFLSAAVNPRKGRALQEWVDDMADRYRHEQQFIPAQQMPAWIESRRFTAAAYDPKSGHLHPLKYTLGLAQAAEQAGVVIHENTAALRIDRTPVPTIHTAQGSVRCKSILLAGNVYLEGLAPELAPRIMPVGTYIVASAPLDAARATALIPTRAAICDTNFVLDYFRLSADDRVIFGGRVSYSTATPINLAPSMRQRMLAVFPQLADVPVEYAWGGYVDITMNRAPDFGRLSGPGGTNIYYLQGFSGHGLALTGLAGKLVAEAIHGDASRFDVFAQLKHHNFPGGKLLRTPGLVAAMAWYRLRDLL